MDDDKQVPAEYSAKWWMQQISECGKELDDKWRNSADTIVDMYLGQYEDEGNKDCSKKYNIFWANTQIIKSALYATPPKPKVTRQWGDAKDDVARTAALILERILNIGMTKDQSDMHDAFKQATEDRLIPGLGQVWLRYVVETEQQEEAEVIVHEDVATDYVHWKDFFWSPARTWNEVTWVARRVWLSKRKMAKRFGQDKLTNLQRELQDMGHERPDLPKGFVKGKFEVFEVWCKESNTVYWIHRALEEHLDKREDPLQLEEFFPCPKPLLSTHTSKTCIPRPDYAMSQDQYEELNVLNTRIYTLTSALRVAGVYDKTQSELKALFTTSENKMIAVENWSMLAEKGGLKGVVDWFPLEVVAGVLEKLMVQRTAVIQQIYELTSISDIMRGASNPRETLGAQKLKSQYSSVRLQLMQQDIGIFVRHAMRIKTEIICKHFQPERIVQMSGIMHTESAMHAPQAVMLLKNYESSEYRIEVSEETLSIADYNAERELRTELVVAVGQFLSQSVAMVQSFPMALPYLLRMIQWLIASFKGSADIEAVLDEAVQAVTQNPPQPADQKEAGPAGKSPQEVQAEMQKTMIEMQGDMKKTQMQLQGQLAIARENNQTKVLIEQMKQGQAQDELAMEAIGMEIDAANAQVDRETAMEQQQLDLTHAAEQSEADRKLAAQKPKTK